MNFLAVRVIPVENKATLPIIQISEVLAKKLKLPSNTLLDVQCSRNTITANVVCINGAGNEIRAAASILNELHLFQEERTYLISYNASSNKLVIGPVIGLLTEISFKDDDHADFKSIHSYCMEMANYSEDIGVIFYVFSLPQAVSENFLEGFFYDNNSWSKALLPYPQVVHNRLHKRTNEKSDMFQQFTKQLQEWGIPYFNSHFLNKWRVHEDLSAAEHLLPFLPETALFSLKTLTAFFEKYPVLFLKPVNGSQGKQIFKITRTPEGYSLGYSSFQQDVSQTYSTLADLYKRLSAHVKRRQYIVQQGLDLLEIEGRPVDFRYLCHRGENNRWHFTSSTARASKNGSFVSNLAQGGEMLSVSSALADRFDKAERFHIRKHLKELALEAANEIGMVSEGIFGELGVDLAVDKTGRPWIIEVNTKPSKNLDSVEKTKTIRPSAKAIILYCLYLISENVKEA